MQTERIKITGTGRVLLYLSNRTQVREIGWIEGDTFHCRRDSRRHIHAVGNSIGFNLLLMRTGMFRFVEVQLLPHGRVLRTTREYILQRGRIFHYKKPGFELQVFLPIDEFGLERALSAEQNPSQSAPAQQQQQQQLPLFERAEASQQRAEAIVHWWRG